MAAVADMAAAVDVATAATARDRGMEATGLGAAMMLYQPQILYRERLTLPRHLQSFYSTQHLASHFYHHLCFHPHLYYCSFPQWCLSAWSGFRFPRWGLGLGLTPALPLEWVDDAVETCEGYPQGTVLGMNALIEAMCTLLACSSVAEAGGAFPVSPSPNSSV
eukprot:CAMPEP_0181396010 /NCGR_PEP_ID=MMETSP1106-20121128/28650_1 /TAXON_ID=81844 /ORGANISM="Mantoniella antarctica, Strain SL-175" /LENGTH=162 /DNA_ID=CAMNT_0023517679 /DNA_START=284 /DNA_END=769 /DNA_ORIENTATION=+